MKTSQPAKKAESVELTAPRKGILQRACACGTTSSGSECESCQKKKRAMLQRKSVDTRAVSDVPHCVQDVLNSSGNPLDPAIRSGMETRFKYDFSKVRVHNDTQAHESANAIYAQAYTVGNHVVFGKNQFAPGTHKGSVLLAHELTHVVQQREASPGPALTIGDAASELEREADRVASGFHRLESTELVSRSAAVRSLQRQAAPKWSLSPSVTTTPVRATPSLQVIEGVLTEATAQSAERKGWRLFWRAVVRRFAPRATTAAALEATTGPLLIGELINLGLALWTIWEIVQFWDELWEEANRLQAQEATSGDRGRVDSPMPTLAKNESEKLDSTPNMTSEEAAKVAAPAPALEQQRDEKSCKSLPMKWPRELPHPGESARLVKIPTGGRRKLSRKVIDALKAPQGPTGEPRQACFPGDRADTYHAHHIHPLFLGGLDVVENLCALAEKRHKDGHPKLVNQKEMLPYYLKCGITQANIYRHPDGQHYHIVGSK